MTIDRRLLLAAAAVLLPVLPSGAQGTRPTVAVIPAVVVKGAAGNSGPVTRAVEEHLLEKGFQVLDQARVQSALRKARVRLDQPQTTRTLGAVREAAGVDYVVYVRVLSVGIGVNTTGLQANILVNVQGKSPSSFVHTRQVGQVFAGEPAEAERAVIPAEAAARAAKALLAGFAPKR